MKPNRIWPLAARRSPWPSSFQLKQTIALLFLGVLCQIIGPALAPAQEDSPRLEGMIAGADGQPATNALVFIFSAAPRDGTKGVISPHYYPDCGRHARTDAEGRFLIQPVEKDLLYRLLVTAPGHRPDYIRDADPMFGGSQLKLKRLRVAGVPPRQRAIGKILEPGGRAVAGARVEVGATRVGDSTTYSGSFGSKVDPMAVSDEHGVFFFDCTNGISGLMVTIDAPRLAKRRMWLEPGQAHLIRLKAGVNVTGRLVESGRPVSGVSVVASTAEQWSEVSMRGFEAASDTNGRFTLPHMPAETRFMIYTKMKEMVGAAAALAPKEVTTTLDGTTVELGDLELSRTRHLRGRVLLADGQPVPDRTRIYLSLENGYDSQDTRLDPDGWFEFQGVPEDEISLSVRVTGYRVSGRNPNKDWLNEGRLVGRLQKDFDEFIIHLEPGARLDSSAAPAGVERQPRQKPLESARLEL